MKTAAQHADKEQRQAFKDFGKLSNRLLDDWNAGRAPWLFQERPGGVAGVYLKNIIGEAWDREYRSSEDCISALHAARAVANEYGTP